MFAHNWAFDGPVLDMFNLLPRRGWTNTRRVIESPPVILQWRKGDRTVLCLDTLNWWRMPLVKIGESIGLAKLPMPGKNARRAEWDIYCKRDVEVIYRVTREWWRFLRRNDLGSFGPTLASQAIRAFRHRFMDHKILIDSNPAALALSREALHGGRVECFRLGRIKGPVSVLDVNSMYPFVMRDGLFPTKLLCHTTNTSLKELEKWLFTKSVVALVKVDTKRNVFAHLKDGRLIFPTGRFIAPLTTPDLMDAFTHGEIRSVLACSVYDAAPIFKRFVSTFYAMRQEATLREDAVANWLLKILMNSLYGKFAQRGNVWEIIRKTEDPTVRQWVDLDYETGAIKTFRQFSGAVECLSRETEAFDSFPAIAAHVTALARQYLARLIDKSGRDRVVYCDTDSLFLSSNPAALLATFPDRTALGALKLEATHDWIVLNGPKDYAFPDKTVIKGIKKNALKTGENSFTQDQFSSLVGLIDRGDLSAPIIKVIRKVLTREYLKGDVRSDGHVLPYRLAEW